ncbi:MAG: hypothetical protein H7X79_00020 [Sporomusaceae bacterium]|nr:hypothetical protein [Sporomusaceae bacterium]
MNQNEFLNMKPGRDLDIKVALEVMGYIWLKHLLQFSAELAVKWLGTPVDLKESCGMYVVVPNSQFVALKERENHAEAVLNFSTEMGPAEEVIRRMEEFGYEYHLETKTEQGANLYYACFKKTGSTSKVMLAGAPTIPEAIVKGALSAMLAY